LEEKSSKARMKFSFVRKNAKEILKKFKPSKEMGTPTNSKEKLCKDES